MVAIVELEFSCGERKGAKMDLEGRIAIITGAGSGIGRAATLELARGGVKTVCCGRREDRLRETASLVEKAGGEALVVKTDITQKAQIDHMVSRTLERFGRIDILYNNAGSFCAVGGLWEVDADLWWQDVEVNLRGTMLCCRAVLPHMMEKGEGIIINMSGGGASGPMTRGSGYGSSKAAILRLTDTLAHELQQVGSSVLVFAMDPRFNRTEMTERLARMDNVGKWLPHVQEHLDANDRNKPEDCARTIVELIRTSTPELSGRLFHAGEDIKNIVEHADEICREDLLVLRFRGRQ